MQATLEDIKNEVKIGLGEFDNEWANFEQVFRFIKL